MGDTIYISNPDSIPYLLDSLPAETRNVIIKEIHGNDKEAAGTGSYFPDIFICCALVIIAFYKIFKNAYLSNDTGSNDSTAESSITEPEFYYYNGQNLNLTDADIISILQKYFVYYACLSGGLKERFLLRLKQFMCIKTFRLPKEETFKEIPVLLSAAAIQLTFGLDEFELSWFQNINVNPAEYFADDPNALRILAGNVEGKTITVAWSHFLKGINNSVDGANVGLHELAHALYYQYVVAENGNKKTFLKELDMAMQEGSKIYRLDKSTQTLFSDYAFRNMQEFWAESIEIFFEKPAAMQTQFPDLFCSIKELLNQDPLNKLDPLLQN